MAVNEKNLLQRLGVSEQIFEILKERIASGEWKPGTKIMSENELAIEFGVSRMSARNAIQRLCALGLLETKPGDGTFVKKFSFADYFSKASDLITLSNSMNDIREFRYYFERDYLALACEKRTDEDIEELKHIFDKMVALSTTEDFDAFFKIDMAFHQRICEMTRNEVFILVNRLLHDMLMSQLKDNTQRYASVKNASLDVNADNYALKLLVEEHRNYIIALEKQDFSIATDNLNTYINTYMKM